MAERMLSNSYAQYKSGTTKVVTWLANAARGCQDVSAIVPSLGAAKDAAKRAKRRQKHTTVSDAKVTLTTSQLLKLANIIVQASVDIPKDIIQTIKAVIAGRTTHAEWYSSCAGSLDTLTAAKNETHQHFIHVLKEVEGLLEEHAANQEKKRPSKKAQVSSGKADNDKESVSNMFSYLQLHEPDENALGDAVVSKPTAPKVQFELEDFDKDKTFAIWCLLQDLHDLRAEVRNLWVKYRDGTISFSVVAEMTLDAIAMAEYAEIEMNRRHEVWSYCDILHYLGVDVSAVGYNVWIYPVSNDGARDVSRGRVCGDQVVDLLCPRAYIICSVLVPELAVKIGSAARDETDEQTDFLRLHRFGEALRSLILSLDSKATKKLLRLPDPFLMACGHLAGDLTTPPNIWVITTCQMYMDIHEVMGSNFTSAITSFWNRLRGDLKSLQAFCEGPVLASGPKENKTVMNNCEMLRAAFNLFMSEPLQERAEEPANRGTSTSPPPFSVYQIVPLQPGMLMNASAGFAHSFGIDIGNYFCTVLSTAYLYRAALKVGALQACWPDMECVIRMQSKKRPFVLDSDAGIASMARCFGLALGLKLKDFAKGRRPHLPKMEHIQHNAKMLELLHSRHKPDGVLLLGSSSRSFAPDNQHRLDAAIQALDKIGGAKIKDPRLEDIYRQYKAGGRFTLSQLLLASETGYTESELDLGFDYISFYQMCEDLLQNVVKCNAVKLVVFRDLSFDPPIPYEVVYALLWDAADRSTPASDVGSSALHAAAKIIEQHVHAKGDQCSENARTQSSGHTIAPRVGPAEEPIDPEPPENSEAEDLLAVCRYYGLAMEKNDQRTGSFCNSKDVHDARVLLHERIGDFYFQKGALNLDGMGAAASQVAAANRERMSEEERQRIDAQYERVRQMVARQRGIN